MRASVNVNGTDITVISKGDDNDCISFTDIARYKNPVWEQLNNPDFKGIEFDSFKHEAGSNAFTLNIPRYVDTFEEEVEIDIDAVQVEIDGRRA